MGGQPAPEGGPHDDLGRDGEAALLRGDLGPRAQVVQHLHRHGRGAAQANPLPPAGIQAEGCGQQPGRIALGALGGQTGDFDLVHPVQTIEPQAAGSVVPAQQVVLLLEPQHPFGGDHHGVLFGHPALVQVVVQRVEAQGAALLQGGIDPVQRLAHRGRRPPAPGGQSHRPAQLGPLMVGGQAGQLGQGSSPQLLGGPGIDGQGVHGGLEGIQVQGVAGHIPAAPQAPAVVNGKAPLRHGAQVPVDALALGSQAGLLQPANELGGGQGMLFVGLLI